MLCSIALIPLILMCSLGLKVEALGSSLSTSTNMRFDFKFKQSTKKRDSISQETSFYTL